MAKYFVFFLLLIAVAAALHQETPQSRSVRSAHDDSGHNHDGGHDGGHEDGGDHKGHNFEALHDLSKRHASHDDDGGHGGHTGHDSDGHGNGGSHGHDSGSGGHHH